MRPGFDTAERPLVAIWETTQACDLACEHCRADAQPARHPDELTTEEARNLLDDLRVFGEGQLVVLSGGDPMKRPDLVDLVDYGTDIGLRMTLTRAARASSTTTRSRASRTPASGAWRSASTAPTRSATTPSVATRGVSSRRWPPRPRQPTSASHSR